MTHFNVIWQSNYNGVSIVPEGDVDYDVLPEEMKEKLYAIEDEAGELAGYTYEVASRWDELTEENIDELKRRALKIINKYFPDATIDDVSYDEDRYST